MAIVTKLTFHERGNIVLTRITCESEDADRLARYYKELLGLSIMELNNRFDPELLAVALANVLLVVVASAPTTETASAVAERTKAALDETVRARLAGGVTPAGRPS